MSISKILTALCVIRQNVGVKHTFADIVYNVSSERIIIELT